MAKKSAEKLQLKDYSDICVFFKHVRMHNFYACVRVVNFLSKKVRKYGKV